MLQHGRPGRWSPVLGSEELWWRWPSGPRWSHSGEHKPSLIKSRAQCRPVTNVHRSTYKFSKMIVVHRQPILEGEQGLRHLRGGVGVNPRPWERKQWGGCYSCWAWKHLEKNQGERFKKKPKTKQGGGRNWWYGWCSLKLWGKFPPQELVQEPRNFFFPPKQI